MTRCWKMVSRKSQHMELVTQEMVLLTLKPALPGGYKRSPFDCELVWGRSSFVISFYV